MIMSPLPEWTSDHMLKNFNAAQLNAEKLLNFQRLLPARKISQKTQLRISGSEEKKARVLLFVIPAEGIAMEVIQNQSGLYRLILSKGLRREITPFPLFAHGSTQFPAVGEDL
jgi:hypothetical protein